jgi:large subunit ribosomal protein L25
MEQIEINVEQRAPGDKSLLRRMRRTGLIPAVVYHKGEKTVPIQVTESDFWKVLHSEAGRNSLINLKVKDEKKKQRTVVVKDIQSHPVTGQVRHVDFHEISLKEKIVVNVPVVERGDAPGVKNDGGVLETPLRELQVECLPTEIPEHIEIDVSKLNINEAIHVKNLIVPSNIKLLNDSDMVVVHVVPPAKEISAETPEGEAKEPEVIGEKKEEGEEGAEGDKKSVKGAAGKEAKPGKEAKGPEKKA